MNLANDCEWTDEDVFMSGPTARRTRLPKVGGYQINRGSDGTICSVTVTVNLVDGDTEHRAEVKFGVNEEDATPRKIEFPHYEYAGFTQRLTALVAATEAVSRLDDITTVETVDDLLQDITTQEPADAWEVVR
jgi:hypothetical protein